MPYSFEKWLAGRWIAGPGIDDALERAKEINRKRISVMINYLGEDFDRKVEAEEAVEVYMRLITMMSEGRINGDISLKPTQIGLSISQALMRSNYVKIMEHAKMHGIFVWLDMEGTDHVEKIIDVYLEVQKQARGGICIQSYLKRSLDDVRRIVKAGGIVRLVKGAYAYKEGTGMIRSRADTTRNYLKIMGYLFDHAQHFMVATHDQSIIKEGLMLNKQSQRKVTYAMLNGIDNQYAKMLAEKGEHVALYVPFGTRWVGYSYRRMKEMGHIRLILHSLFKSQQL